MGVVWHLTPEVAQTLWNVEALHRRRRGRTGLWLVLDRYLKVSGFRALGVLPLVL